MLRQRYRIFFFPGKDCAHSLTQIWKNLYFFFFRKSGKKKNTAVFFFFPGKDYMSLTQLFWMSLYKKIGGKLCFFKIAIFKHILRCIFFFQDLYFFSLYFFFSWKRLNFTHSLVSNLCIFFFPAPEKKKIHCFYSLTRFWTKLSQK